VNLRGLFWILVILVASGVLIHFGLFGMQALFHKNARAADEQLLSHNVTREVARQAPNFPEPRLQVSPSLDLETFRAREDQQLQTYGWVDRKAGIVRIPINEAMDLVARRGLPTRSAAETQNGKSSVQLLQERPQQR
jgi:hypothetical protein